MNDLYEKSPWPGGGKASSGGSSYHLSFRSGSRAELERWLEPRLTRAYDRAAFGFQTRSSPK